MEQAFWAAIDGNQSSEMNELISSVGINWKNSSVAFPGWSFLHLASFRGHFEAVRSLLSHPNIDVNLRSSYGPTPLLLAALAGHEKVVRLLLENPKTDCNIPGSNSRTPLYFACEKGFTELVKVLVALRGTSLDLDLRGYGNHTALEIAIENKRWEIAKLLEELMGDQMGTMRRLQVELGLIDPVAAYLFASVVFLCDEFFTLEEEEEEEEKKGLEIKKTALRFFALARRLPMELQMVLCHRVYGSMRNRVLSKDSENAFRALVRELEVAA